MARVQNVALRIRPVAASSELRQSLAISECIFDRQSVLQERCILDR